MTSGVPFVASSPFESSPTRGRLDPEHAAGEGRAHEGELDEVLRADLRVGARVEQRERVLGDGHGDGQAGAVHARGALDVEERGRERRPGGAAADERVGLAGPDGLGRPDDGGVGRGARGAGGVGGLGDGDRRVDDLDERVGGRLGPSASAGPKSRTRTPRPAASSAPAATSAGPRSAPFASTATVVATPG